jgi:hypothetical protein
MKPELSVKKKVLALERRKQQLDSLIAFIKSHPHATNGTRLIPLWHRTGLLFDDYALNSSNLCG